MNEENKENKSQKNIKELEGEKNSLEDNTEESLDNDDENNTSLQSSLKEETKDVAEEKKTQDLEKELEETKDKMLRVLAESENTRKQIEKNKIDMAKYGVQPLARELINVVDNFDRALNSLTDEAEKKTLEGFELIQKEIVNILDKFNVKKIKAFGEPFDANLHQAMFEKPSKEFENGLVCEIVQDGYMLHDRLLRPAMVGIAKNDKEKEEEDKKEEEDNKENQEQN